jgi:hypothetical protein
MARKYVIPRKDIGQVAIRLNHIKRPLFSEELIYYNFYSMLQKLGIKYEVGQQCQSIRFFLGKSPKKKAVLGYVITQEDWDRFLMAVNPWKVRIEL